MTVVKASLSKDLEEALERYCATHALSDEAVMQKALKRFLLEEGYPAEDETLSEEELEALRNQKNAEYDAWEDIKKSL
jgi:plasmid stability protein